MLLDGSKDSKHRRAVSDVEAQPPSQVHSHTPSAAALSSHTTKAAMLLQAGPAVVGKGHPVSAFQYLQTGAWVQPTGKLAALYLACLALLVCLAHTLPPLEELQAKAGIPGQFAGLAPGTKDCRMCVVFPAPPCYSLQFQHMTIRAACAACAERCGHRLAACAWYHASP